MIVIKSYINYKNNNISRINNTCNNTNNSNINTGNNINNTYCKNNNTCKNNVQYSLNHSFFDPSHSSPPNDFMEKLHLRMSVYNSLIKDDNFSAE